MSVYISSAEIIIPAIESEVGFIPNLGHPEIFPAYFNVGKRFISKPQHKLFLSLKTLRQKKKNIVF